MTIPPFRRHFADISPNPQEAGERRRGYSAAALSPLGGGGIGRPSGRVGSSINPAAIPPSFEPTARDSLRPPTIQARRPAILDLVRQGLRPLDIAATMRLPIGEVFEAARAARVDGSGQQGLP